MKKIVGVKRSWSSYTSMQKHKCPDCGSILKTVEVSKVVDPTSPQIDSSDLKMDHKTYFAGPVNIISKEFECPNCGKHVTVKEMKEYEGLVNGARLSGSEKKKIKEQKNVTAIILTVLLGLVVFIIYSLIKQQL